MSSHSPLYFTYPHRRIHCSQHQPFVTINSLIIAILITVFTAANINPSSLSTHSSSLSSSPYSLQPTSTLRHYELTHHRYCLDVSHLHHSLYTHHGCSRLRWYFNVSKLYVFLAYVAYFNLHKFINVVIVLIITIVISFTPVYSCTSI